MMNNSPVFVVKPAFQSNVGPTKSLGVVNKQHTTTGRKYRMVALDLDGTLLNSKHQISDVQVEYLQSLYRRGFTVCIATGRAAPSVYEHVQKLNLPDPIPVVCSNGARGFRIDAKTLQKEELFYTPVPKDVVYETIRIAEQCGFAVQYYHDEFIYVNSSKPEHVAITNKYSELTGSQILPVTDNFESMLRQNQLPSKLLVLFNESKLEEAAHQYTSKLSDKATVVMGAFDWFLEVLNPLVHKGHGLSAMCQELAIPLEECIAMGDGSNDLEFLEMAGLGLAMKNAKEVAKKRASWTIEWNNDEHGVMKALQRLELGGKLDV